MRGTQHHSDAGTCSESGMVTVEVAISLAVVIVVVIGAIFAISLGIAHADACHQARDAVRHAIRGETTSIPANINLTHNGRTVTATAQAQYGLMGMSALTCSVTGLKEQVTP